MRKMAAVELEPLEPSPEQFQFKPTVDRRPRVPEPLPVKLVAVADARLPAAAGLEQKLDAFYVRLLGFERRHDEPDRPRGEAAISYPADNFTLHPSGEGPPLGRTG